MTQHTPGPWEYTPKDNRGWHSIRSSDHRTVAEIICQLPWEAEANARLITAAPEMFRLLKAITRSGLPGDIEDAKALLARIEGESNG